MTWDAQRADSAQRLRRCGGSRVAARTFGTTARSAVDTSRPSVARHARPRHHLRHRRPRAAPRHGRGRHPRRPAAFTIVGLADTAVREARERVRAAMLNSGFEFPLKRDHRQPRAGVPAQGRPGLRPRARPRVLAASGQLPGRRARALRRLRRARRSAASCAPCRGALAVAEGARAARARRARRPAGARARGGAGRGLEVLGVAPARGRRVLRGGERRAAARRPRRRRSPRPSALDLADVRGHAADRALEIAAAGGHNLLLAGRRAPARRCSRGACRRSCRR